MRLENKCQVAARGGSHFHAEWRGNRLIDSPCGKAYTIQLMTKTRLQPVLTLKRSSRGVAETLAGVLVLCLALVTGARGQTNPYPEPKGHLNDMAGVVDESMRSRIETLLTNFENRTGTQIAVVTVRSLDGQMVEEYANGLYRAWGIGAKSGENKDKGALLLIAIDDRKTRLEVGYGLEGDLPDGLSGELIRRMRPLLRQSDYSQAVWVGTRSIVDTLAERWKVSLDGIEDRQFAWKQKKRSGTISPFLILVVVVVILIVISIIVNGFRGGGRGGGGISDLWWLAPVIFNGSGGSFGGGSSGGRGDWGGGGGWGGFDGGSSGGGGASDSW